MPIPIGNGKLANLTFAVVDTDEQNAADSEELAPLASQEGLQQAPQAIVIALEAITQRMDAYERRRLDTVTSIGLGFVGGLLFCAILIGLAWLYGG